MDSQELIKQIKYLIRIKFETKKEFAKKIGKSEQCLSSILSNKGKSMNYKTLKEILDGLGYEIEIKEKVIHL